MGSLAVPSGDQPDLEDEQPCLEYEHPGLACVVEKCLRGEWESVALSGKVLVPAEFCRGI